MTKGRLKEKFLQHVQDLKIPAEDLSERSGIDLEKVKKFVESDFNELTLDEFESLIDAADFIPSTGKDILVEQGGSNNINIQCLILGKDSDKVIRSLSEVIKDKLKTMK